MNANGNLHSSNLEEEKTFTFPAKFLSSIVFGCVGVGVGV